MITGLPVQFRAVTELIKTAVMTIEFSAIYSCTKCVKKPRHLSCSNLVTIAKKRQRIYVFRGYLEF